MHRKLKKHFPDCVMNNFSTIIVVMANWVMDFPVIFSIPWFWQSIGGGGALWRQDNHFILKYF